MHDEVTPPAGPNASITSAARAWIQEDPDPDTRKELAELVASETDDGRAELAARFSGTLRFGTAGLRGELGAGPMRMNRTVVIRAAAGLAAYLRGRAEQQPGDGSRERDADGEPGLVVIGYDARYKSAEFARDTAAVVTGAGLRAALLPRALPTPVLAFAIRHLGAVAGVMVTASHNPPRDNGYKVYLGHGYPDPESRGGAQIVQPADSDIAAEIDAVGPLHEVPRPEAGWDVLGEEVVEAYLERAGGALTAGSPRTLRTVHTALHGVGWPTLEAAFVRAGFPAPVPVAEQAEPDPDFPTVSFPNPEEPGAMDLAFATARAAADRGEPVDLILANDPDADRCAVAVPDPGQNGDGTGRRMLHGDEVTALLATHLVRKGARGAFATTIVSSSLLSRIAAAAGQPYEETLTGFKWLARVDGVRFAAEEALGYCVDPDGVRDKDGITAALLVAELAAELKEEGRTLQDLLDELALEHGLHATDQLSVRVEDLSVIADAMVRLRATPPDALDGLVIASAEDLTRGTASLPPTDGLRYRLAGDTARGIEGARVVVRPSGTEPKLKCYLEAVLPVPDRASLPAVRARAADLLTALKVDLARAAGV